jgi:AhpD family alkylhydroperoxidase
MPRLPYIDVDTLTPAQQRALEFSPVTVKYVVAHARDTFTPLYQAVGALRVSPDLDPLLRQLVILLAAKLGHCEYIWVQHEGRTLEAGATAEQIAAIREGRSFDGREGIVLAYLDDLYNDRRPDDARLEEVTALVSTRCVVEAILQLGLYVMFGRLVEAAAIPTDEPHIAADWTRLSDHQDDDA